jgi:RNA polymerase sigma factor (sigma-70 family)
VPESCRVGVELSGARAYVGAASYALQAPGLREASLRLVSDDRLSKIAATGDRHAFAVIYERYHQALYRYCRSILRDPDDASDALQSAMCQVMRALPGEARDLALKPWLYRVAHNEAISLLRRRRPTAELSGGEMAAVAGPQQNAEDRERFARLIEDLSQLPDAQRSALVMHELYGLKYGEIALAFEITEAAAKQAVYHARSSLQSLADGREMECRDARRMLAGGDGRVLRARKLNSHVRHCKSCRSTRRRPRQQLDRV